MKTPFASERHQGGLEELRELASLRQRIVRSSVAREVC